MFQIRCFFVYVGQLNHEEQFCDDWRKCQQITIQLFL